MNLAILLASLWVLAATCVAMLPMRHQFLPGSILLALAPVLIGMLGYQFGWVVGIGAFVAFVSMFRNPLRYYARKWTGRGTPEFAGDEADL